MPVKNFSSIGGYSVAATEVLNTSRALKNISAMHMVSDHFTDANKDIFILKRQTDAANNTMQLSVQMLGMMLIHHPLHDNHLVP